MDYDMSRWVKPRNDQETTVAKRVDAFIKANYSEKILGDGEDYRVVIDIKPVASDKKSAAYLLDLITILSDADPESALGDMVNRQYAQAGRKTLQDIIEAITVSDEEKKFATSYIKDVVIFQAPFQYAAAERLMCWMSVCDPGDLLAHCSRYKPELDPMILHSEDSLDGGEISLIARCKEEEPGITVYADIPLQAIIALKEARKSSGGMLVLPSGSLVELESGMKYILNQDARIPIVNILGFSIGWDDEQDI